MSGDTTAFQPRVNVDNPDPRTPCAVLLDVSGSMDGHPIERLNEGLALFQRELQANDVARKRVELELVTFGGEGVKATGFQEAQAFNSPSLEADGGTPLAEALLRALNDLTERKKLYREAGIDYSRPWLFLLTDGVPTDDRQLIESARNRVRADQEGLHVALFAIGVGDAVDMAFLESLCTKNKPRRLDELKFDKFFQWLSNSLSIHSQRDPTGSNDKTIASKEKKTGVQQTLPPAEEWTG
ncbi:VWA domain-containing protein [Nonomuraea sp. B19D2]|uniref:vWA domain-containing protein n=1 Tax=Nonomuraea sp. B19D2 TaxID=3159561 RepID=UPI0032DB4175